MKVNGKDDIPYIMENKIHVWNHQPVHIVNVELYVYMYIYIYIEQTGFELGLTSFIIDD